MRVKNWFVAIAGLAAATAASAAAPVVPAPAPVAPAADPSNIVDLDLSTGGRVQILLRPDKAPMSVERIKALTRRGFYNGLTFHRVIEGFMAQGGDPKGDGSGGSDLPDLKAEFNDLPHVRGAMAMARADKPDSANSQFFIMLTANLQLDGKYTVVGRVISGMNYVDLVSRGEPPADPSKIVRAALERDDGPATVTPIAPVAATSPVDAEQAKIIKNFEKTPREPKKPR